MRKKQEKYITLKEAAEISGYDPDYIGQLIRKGKLPGKQVYYTVAWVTTEDAVREYVARGKERSSFAPSFRDLILQKLRQLRLKLFFELEFAKLARGIFYAVIALSGVFVLVLFYVFAVNVEHMLTERAIERAMQEGGVFFE